MRVSGRIGDGVSRRVCQILSDRLNEKIRDRVGDFTEILSERMREKVSGI